jgi:large subunit ribosomal protein L29
MVNIKDLRTESIEELYSKTESIRKKYMELRFQHASGTLKNPIELRAIRRDIAKMITVINEKKNEKQ